MIRYKIRITTIAEKSMPPMAGRIRRMGDIKGSVSWYINWSIGLRPWLIQLINARIIITQKIR
ncbi:hypothetical protein D3C78_1681450 [compost metagenome]